MDTDGSAGHNFITHTVHIRDNDPTPALAFSADVSKTAVSGNEGIQSNGDAAVPNPVLKLFVVHPTSGAEITSGMDITFTVTEHSSPGTATFKSTSLAATAPWDWKFDGGGNSYTGTIPAHESFLDIPIIINDDAYWEGSVNETVKITATAGNNSQGVDNHEYTIIENETKPTLRFKLFNSEVTSLEEDSEMQTGILKWNYQVYLQRLLISLIVLPVQMQGLHRTIMLLIVKMMIMMV